MTQCLIISTLYNNFFLHLSSNLIVRPMMGIFRVPGKLFRVFGEFSFMGKLCVFRSSVNHKTNFYWQNLCEISSLNSAAKQLFSAGISLNCKRYHKLTT